MPYRDGAIGYVGSSPSRCAASQEDAERPERHTHAEHGHDSVLTDAYRSARSMDTTAFSRTPIVSGVVFRLRAACAPSRT
ncbi:hypothetical protein GIW26_12880 [Pseudomonas syringae]|nr:hypothetical protein [Pseudomonas syringae]POP69056.1 hypothetical protein CXB35_15120 [Pseudomonas syringae]